MSDYRICPSCLNDRANLDTAAIALHCRECKGTGFVRSRETYVCNKCGDCLCPPIGTMNQDAPHGLVEATVSGGYDSRHLFDTTNYSFSLCELCLRNLFNECAVPPKISHYMGPGWKTYQEDRVMWEDRLWEESEAFMAHTAAGLCTTRLCGHPATQRELISGLPTNVLACDAHARLHCTNMVVFPENGFVLENGTHAVRPRFNPHGPQPDVLLETRLALFAGIASGIVALRGAPCIIRFARHAVLGTLHGDDEYLFVPDGLDWESKMPAGHVVKQTYPIASAHAQGLLHEGRFTVPKHDHRQIPRLEPVEFNGIVRAESFIHQLELDQAERRRREDLPEDEDDMAGDDT